MKRPKRLSATTVNAVNLPGRYGDGRGGPRLSRNCVVTCERLSMIDPANLVPEWNKRVSVVTVWSVGSGA